MNIINPLNEKCYHLTDTNLALLVSGSLPVKY